MEIKLHPERKNPAAKNALQFMSWKSQFLGAWVLAGAVGSATRVKVRTKKTLRTHIVPLVRLKETAPRGIFLSLCWVLSAFWFVSWDNNLFNYYSIIHASLKRKNKQRYFSLSSEMARYYFYLSFFVSFQLTRSLSRSLHLFRSGSLIIGRSSFLWRPINHQCSSTLFFL